MNFKSKYIAIFPILLSISLAQASAKENAYLKLDEPVIGSPAVIEFFSFYCGPCYAFNEIYHIDKIVSKELPKDIKLVKYHVGLMGEFGNELTEAWSIAVALGIDGKIEPLLFDAQMNKKLKSIEDINNIFESVGISSIRYNEMKENDKVKNLIQTQNEAIKKFNVTSTPSFYVSGKYKVINQNVTYTNNDDFANNYADLIKFLLNKN